MGSLLGLVALLAAIALAVRAWRRRAAERAQPGRRSDRPIAIEDYGEIDWAVRRQRCACGSSYALRGEGPARQPGLRIARLECRRCERETELYFDVSGVPH